MTPIFQNIHEYENWAELQWFESRLKYPQSIDFLCIMSSGYSCVKAFPFGLTIRHYMKVEMADKLTI